MIIYIKRVQKEDVVSSAWILIGYDILLLMELSLSFKHTDVE